MARKTYFAALFICLCGLAMTAQAQKPYRLPDSTIGSRIHRLADSVKAYNYALNKGLKRSLYPSVRDEKVLKDANDLEISTFRLKERFDKDRYGSERSLSDDIRSVMHRASNVKLYMDRNFGRTGADDRWAEVKQNLDLVARSYNVNWPSYYPYRPNRMDDEDARELLELIKADSELFRKGMESYLKVDRSIDRYTRDDINGEIRHFISLASRLRGRVDDKDGGTPIFNEMMRSASKISSFINSKRYRLPSQIRDDWKSINRKLWELSSGYKITPRAYQY
jgi:hypothetical protein